MTVSRSRIVFWVWVLLAAVGGSVFGFGVIGPLPPAEIAQRALLDEYLAVYCHPDRDHAERWIGEAQVLSRLTIKAKLGERALAEYASCKIGLK